MNGFADVSSSILVLVAGNVLDDVPLTEPQIVCMDVDNWLDAFVLVVAA